MAETNASRSMATSEATLRLRLTPGALSRYARGGTSRVHRTSLSSATSGTCIAPAPAE
jgi:hypothetical protein